MKNLALIGFVSLFSIGAMADVNFNNSTSELEITDLKVDGVPAFSKAKVHLNFGNRLFTVTEALPITKTPPPSPPTEVFRTNGYAFTSLGCARTGTEEVTCNIQLVNEQKDRRLSVFTIELSASGGLKKLMFDDLGNSYTLSRVLLNNSSISTYFPGNYNLSTMQRNVPVKLGLVFNGVDRQAKLVSLLNCYFLDDESRTQFSVKYDNLKL